MAYQDFHDFPRRTISDKLLRDKSFNIAKISKYDGYQRALASIVYKNLDKKSVSLTYKSAPSAALKNKIMSNQVAPEIFFKKIIRKLGERNVRSSVIDNKWSANLANMQLISQFHKRICNRSIKLWLRDNGIEMHSTHNERKFTVRTLRNNNYKYVTSVQKDVCIDKVNDIINKQYIS